MKSDPGSECSLSRRWLLKAGATIGGSSALAGRFAFLKFASANMLNGAEGSAGTKMQSKIHVAVIGAGAFGGWTALYLLRRGARVTLLDAWGPGNARASSGGETRFFFNDTATTEIYTHLAARALALWKAHERGWRRKLYHPIGVLWLAEDDGAHERAALPLVKEAGVVFEELTGTETARRYPQISCERVRWAIFERDGGYLIARVACAAVLDAVLAAGGEYRQLAAEPAGPVEGGELGGVRLSDGGTLRADHYVFACGPWLGRLFPDVIGDRVRATRQEVYFFGTPAGDQRFTEEALPVWARSEEHTSELQSRLHLVCRLLLEKKKKNRQSTE